MRSTREHPTKGNRYRCLALLFFLATAAAFVAVETPAAQGESALALSLAAGSRAGRTEADLFGRALRKLKGRKRVCGDDATMAAQVVTQTPRSTPFLLDPDGTSYIDWMFERTDGWHVVTGSQFHAGDDYYADDWNLGTGDADEGYTVLSAFPGEVIYAGSNGSGYGNQVIVRSQDDDTFAIRYAHLKTIAVRDGDSVHFGSEIGTVGGTGSTPDQYIPHLHSVLYKNIDQGDALDRLGQGRTPSGDLDGGPTDFVARFFNDGNPQNQCSEDLPCWTWNGNVDGCNAQSILFGARRTQDCAYYFCSGLCLPRGTSNCRAGCPTSEGPNPVPCNLGDDDDTDESLPCHTWNGDVRACDQHSILFGDEHTRDCAYYLTTDLCRPRGTSNCLAGIDGDCRRDGCP